MKIIGFILLFAPLIWELWNDRNGDAHVTRGWLHKFFISSKKIDVIARGIIDILAAIIVSWITGVPFMICFATGIAIHILLFDYLIAYILIRKKIIKGHWFSYMGEAKTDKKWENISPYLRLLIRVIIFVVTINFYF